MSWRTQLFVNVAAWEAAGRPIGGVFPVAERNREDPVSWPERYRDLAVVYWIALPGGQWWCPWQRAFNSERGWHGDGWNVAGPLYELTITPSIDTASYHGHVTAGVITDDIAGRTYPIRRPIMESNTQEPTEAQQLAAAEAALARSARIEALIAEGKTQDEALAIVDAQAPDPAIAPAPETPAAEPTPEPVEELVRVQAIAPGFDGVRQREIGEHFTVPASKVGRWMKVVE